MQEERIGLFEAELFSKTAFIYLTSLGSAILGYIVILLSLRYIGESKYGIVVFALSFSGLLSFITDLGVFRAHLKKISEGKDVGECLSVYLVFKIATGAIYAIISILISILVLGQEGIEIQYSVFLLIIYFTIVSLTSVATYTHLARGDVVRSQIIAISEPISRIIFIGIVIYYNLGTLGLASIFPMSGLISFFVALVLSFRLFRNVKWNFNKKLFSEYMHFAGPLILVTIVGTLFFYIDKVLIQFSSNSNQTAIYYSSQQLLAIYTYLGPAIIVVMFPAISKLNSIEINRDKISTLIRSSIRFLAVMTIPITSFLVLFSSDILATFLSASFRTGSIAFSLLSIGFGLSILIAPFSSHILGIGDIRLYAKYNLIAFGFSLLFDFLFIPSNLFSLPLFGFGIGGAAFAFLISQLICLTLFYWNANVKLGVSIMPIEIGKIILLSMIAASASYLIYAYLPVGLILIKLFCSFNVFISIFLFASIRFNMITKQEIIIGLRVFFPIIKKHKS